MSGAAGGLGRGSFGDLVERVGDGGVVGGGEREGLPGQPPAGFAAQAAVVGLQFFNQGGIVGDARDDGDVFKVLGGGADHGRAADVDVFDQMAEGDAGLSGGLLEGVEIDDHHVDGLDAVRGDGGLVFLVAANVEQAAVDLGMEGLDAAVEHLGKAGQIADVLDAEAGLAQCPRGAAGGDQLHAKAGQDAGKLDQAGLVGNAQQGAPNLFCIARNLDSRMHLLRIDDKADGVW